MTEVYRLSNSLYLTYTPDLYYTGITEPEQMFCLPVLILSCHSSSTLALCIASNSLRGLLVGRVKFFFRLFKLTVYTITHISIKHVILLRLLYGQWTCELYFSGYASKEYPPCSFIFPLLFAVIASKR